MSAGKGFPTLAAVLATAVGVLRCASFGAEDPAPTSTADASTADASSADASSADVAIPEGRVAFDVDAAPWYLAVDDTYVYWSSYHASHLIERGDGKLRRMPKLGGPVEVIAAIPNSFDLRLDGEFIVFTSSLANGGVYRAFKDGGARDVISSEWATDVAVNDGAIFFVAHATSQANVVRYTLDGGSSVLASTVNSAEGIVADGTYVYWAARGEDTVMRKALGSDAAAAPWARGQDRARRLVADDDAVYWTNWSNVARMPKDAAIPSNVFDDDEVGVGSILIDANHLYVASSSAGRVTRVDKRTGANPVVIAAGLASPVGLAQDEVAIYVSDQRAKKIYRFPKPR